jgi:hypothetical protein
MRTDRRINGEKMRKLMVAFRSFSKAPKNERTRNSGSEITRTSSVRKLNKKLNR